MDTGSHEAWGTIWNETASRMLYTSGTPRTLLELWQRAYFEDLWAAAGDDALSLRWCELGAGRGTTSTYLRAAGAQVTMVDLSDDGFEVCRTNHRALGLEPPQMVTSDVRETPFEDGAFDVVFNIGLLEHFHEPGPVLKETARLLAPGGLAWQVIVPSNPCRNALLARSLMRPTRALRDVARALRARWRPPEIRQGDMVRTPRCPEAWWEEESQRVGGSEASCVPYNPYPTVYGLGHPLEQRFTVPVYRAHLARRARLGRPALACPGWLSVAQLLTFRGAHLDPGVGSEQPGAPSNAST